MSFLHCCILTVLLPQLTLTRPLYLTHTFTPSSVPASHFTLLSSLGHVDFTEEDVFIALSSLKPSIAMGINDIPPKVLSLSAVALTSPIHHLFTLCLSQGLLPLEWKTHKIIPIFKSGKRSSVKKISSNLFALLPFKSVRVHHLQKDY